MNIEQANQIVSKHEPLVVVCTYNILFINDICCGQVIEALEALKYTPHFRQKVKQLAGMVKKARHDYEYKLNGIISDKSGFFADANDRFLEEVQHDVEVFYYALKQEMDNLNTQYSSQLARLELARTLCECACLQYDRRMEEMYRKDPRFKGFYMDYLRLTNLSRLMNELIDHIHVGHTINLNTPQCSEAFEALVRRWNNIGHITSAITSAEDDAKAAAHLVETNF